MSTTTGPALSAKDQLMEILAEHPEDSSFEDLLRALAFHRLVERGEASIRQGVRVAPAEIRRQLRTWDS